MKRPFKTLLVLAIAALLGAAPSARAQDFLSYPGAVAILTRDFDPANPTQSVLKPVFGDPNLMRQIVNTAWQASRASIADQIIAQMGRANSVSKGVTPYNIVCTMGQPGDLSVKPGAYANGSTLEMKYIVRGNWIEFDTTQPTALGKWADPRFSCTYDLTLNLALTFGEAPGPLRMTSVQAQVSNSKLDSHGLIADLVFVANDVAKLFGTDFIKKAQNAIDGKGFDFTNKLNEGLGPFNALLAQFGGEGYALANSLLSAPGAALPGGLGTRSLPGMAPEQPQLLVYLDNESKFPTRGTGEIRGAIKWKKALGEPAAARDDRAPILAPGFQALGRVKSRHPYARAFRIRAVAQSGFGREGMFVPPMTEVGVLQSVTLDAPTPGRTGTAAGTGDEYVLRYVIDQLPLGIPIKVEASLNPLPWQGEVGAGYSRGIGPSNWTGVITLKPNRLGNITSQTLKTGGIGSALRAAMGGTATGGAAPAASTMAGTMAPGAKEGIIIVSGKGAAAAKSGAGFEPRAGISIEGKTGVFARVFKGGAVALNPQPLPPKIGDAVALNPQPLPAKTGGFFRAKSGQIGELSTAQASDFLRAVPRPKTTPGAGFDLNTSATATTVQNSALESVFKNLPKPPIDNPTGTLAIADIDFEVGLIAGPR